MTTLRAIDSFGYLNATPDRDGDAIDDIERAHTTNLIAYIPLVGTCIGVIRIVNTILEREDSPMGWNVAQIVRGSFETIGCSLLIALVDLIITAVRWFNQCSKKKKHSKKTVIFDQQTGSGASPPAVDASVAAAAPNPRPILKKPTLAARLRQLGYNIPQKT